MNTATVTSTQAATCGRTFTHGRHDYVPTPNAAPRPCSGSLRGTHALPVLARTDAAALAYRPRHCAGSGCLHDHPDQLRTAPTITGWTYPDPTSTYGATEALA